MKWNTTIFQVVDKKEKQQGHRLTLLTSQTYYPATVGKTTWYEHRIIQTAQGTG